MENDDTIVDAFLDGQPRADEWRQLKETLIARREHLLHERAAATDVRQLDSLSRQLRELDIQIDALAQEEAITQFVESSVRASLALPQRPSDAENEDDIYE